MGGTDKAGTELEYTAWVQGFYEQVALVWPLPFAAFFGIILFSDVKHLPNVTLGVPMVALCLYQYFLTKRKQTLQVRNCWRLQCVMSAWVYLHFLSGAVRLHPVTNHGDIICNLYATVPQQLFSMIDDMPSFTLPLYFVSHVLVVFLQHAWFTGHQWPIALARSIAVQSVCLALYIKLARHCRTSYQRMVHAKTMQPLHSSNTKSSVHEAMSVSAKGGTSGATGEEEGFGGHKSSGPLSTTPAEQQQSDTLESQRLWLQQEQLVQQQLEQLEQQLAAVEGVLVPTADGADAADAVQLHDATDIAHGTAAEWKKPYRSRRTRFEVSLTLEGALSPEMIDTKAIRQLIHECERLCPGFVQDVAVRGGCAVLSFDLTVMRDESACKAVCKKILGVAQDWVNGQGIRDPVSQRSPTLVAQAWDCFAQTREAASDNTSNSDASSTDSASFKAPKPRLILPKPSFLMPPPQTLSASPQSHSRSTAKACATRDLELEVWVKQGGVGPDWEVRGWEGRKDSPEEDVDMEGKGNGALHMRLLACTQGRFLAVRVLGQQQKGDALVLKVHVALPTRMLAGKGCPLALQLWQGGCMLCSTIAALLPQAMADSHTELDTWVSHEQQQLLKQRQLLLQRKQLLLQQRQALQQHQQQQEQQQEKQQMIRQLRQLEQGPDSGVQEFLADLVEWQRFQGSHSNSSSSSSSSNTISSRDSSCKIGTAHSDSVVDEAYGCADSTAGTDGGASEQSEAVHMMRDIGMDLLLHSLRYGLEKFSVMLLQGLASPPFNLAPAAIAADPAFKEDACIRKALAAATAAAAEVSGEAPLVVGQSEGSLEGEALKQQENQQQQQQQQSAEQQSVVQTPPATNEKGAEGVPCKSSAVTAQNPKPLDPSWSISQHRLLVARWALLLTIGLTIHALHHSSLRAQLYLLAGILAGIGVVVAALKGNQKQVKLLVLCMATIQVAYGSEASTENPPFLLLTRHGLDVCAHLSTTVPYLLILEPSLSLLPILPLANVVSNTKVFHVILGASLPMAILRATALQAISVAVYAIIQKKARANFVAQQVRKTHGP